MTTDDTPRTLDGLTTLDAFLEQEGTLEELRALVQKGIDSGEPADGEEAFARIGQRLNARIAELVAECGPATPEERAPQVDREQARKAGASIRELARTLKLGRFNWREWKANRDQGRS